MQGLAVSPRRGLRAALGEPVEDGKALPPTGPGGLVEPFGGVLARDGEGGGQFVGGGRGGGEADDGAAAVAGFPRPRRARRVVVLPVPAGPTKTCSIPVPAITWVTAAVWSAVSVGSPCRCPAGVPAAVSARATCGSGIRRARPAGGVEQGLLGVEHGGAGPARGPGPRRMQPSRVVQRHQTPRGVVDDVFEGAHPVLRGAHPEAAVTRAASANRLSLVHDERRRCTAATAAAAKSTVCSAVSCVTRAAGGGDCGARSRTATVPAPVSAVASSRQRCCSTGSGWIVFAGRVARVAVCRIRLASGPVGGRPCRCTKSTMLASASSVMPRERLENPASSSGSSRSMTKSGLRPGPRSTSTHSTPSRRVSSSASSTSYSSDIATAAWWMVLPSIERHTPSSPWTRFATATWECRFGSPARESKWSNRAATQPAGAQRPGPGVPGAGEQHLAFEPVQHHADHGVVGLLDLGLHLWAAERPQHRGALRHRERQVIPGHPVDGEGAVRLALVLQAAAQRLTGDRVVPVPEQPAQGGFVDAGAGRQAAAVVQPGDPGADPHPGRQPGRQVVLRQLTDRRRRVPGRGVPQQVPVAGTRTHNQHCHHPRFTTLPSSPEPVGGSHREHAVAASTVPPAAMRSVDMEECHACARGTATAAPAATPPRSPAPDRRRRCRAPWVAWVSAHRASGRSDRPTWPAGY